MGRRENTVVAGEVLPGRWDEDGQFVQELGRAECETSTAVMQRSAKPENGVTVVVKRQPVVGDGRPGAVAAQALEGVPSVGVDGASGVQRVSEEE